LSRKPCAKAAAKSSPAERKAKRKAAAKPAGKSAGKSAERETASKPSAAPNAAEAQARNSLDAFIDATAQTLDLPVDPEWLPAIRMNLQVTLRQAALVAEFALADDAEPAPVFEA
jgi:hypothetical protein